MSGFAEVIVEFLPTCEGGRSSPVFLGKGALPGYMPHFVVHGGDNEYLGVQFVDGPDELVSPGGSATATVRFMYEPRVNYCSLIKGAAFDIREGGRTVGSGRVVARIS